MYFRPCCDGIDPGDWCNASARVWFIVFGNGNEDGWCWDQESCARRRKTHPALMTSTGLPTIFSRGDDPFGSGIGAFSKSGEANSNFYKSFAAFVPSCSSDMFVGGGSGR